VTTPVPVGQAATLRALATAMFRTAAPVAIGTVVAAVVVFTLRSGAPGAWGAALGGGVAALSSLITLAVMRRMAASQPHAVMVASLGSSLTKAIVLLVALFGLGQVPGVDRWALALSMLAVFIVVSFAEGWAGYRQRSYVVDPMTSGSVTDMSGSTASPEDPAGYPADAPGSRPVDRA
jgi:ATP synthase protein I